MWISALQQYGGISRAEARCPREVVKPRAEPVPQQVQCYGQIAARRKLDASLFQRVVEGHLHLAATAEIGRFAVNGLLQGTLLSQSDDRRDLAVA